ncbi:plakophilin-1-like [Hypomesus transpacificus]|uniref:plakophilin-1-like n=1 Tax=Hypomesus transpacificus TaxID=137520 RepID=UPI001F080B11|nr:plakophilin-1-like [Hypomesus transpacificus]
MMLAPLKSVLALEDRRETSLALPSSNQFGSGRQRVLDQVQTIKRTKSRNTIKSSSGSISPASPIYNYTGLFTKSFKSLPDTLNGNYYFPPTFSANGVSKTGSSTRKLARNSSQWDGTLTSPHPLTMGQVNSSRSEPDLGRFPRARRPAASQQARVNRSSAHLDQKRSTLVATNRNSRLVDVWAVEGGGLVKVDRQLVSSQKPVERVLSKHSVVDTKTSGTKSKDAQNIKMKDLTMKEAVDFLYSGDENYQHCGASFIQHNTFTEDKAKQEVRTLKGIAPLVALLRSPNEQVQQTASAALRNLAFKDSSNKEEVQRCGGVNEALAVLRQTPSSETQKHLTGLLWNLSSVDDVKPELVDNALPVLMETVVLPFTGQSDQLTIMDPEVFYHSTGCLRNLSCAKQNNRQAMRKCRGLVESLLSYVQDCVDADRPDDKSVENCVCVLHNLTFQLETEAPALFSRITALGRLPCRASSQGDTSPIGCFSQQSNKLEQESHFDYPVLEEQRPSGAGWLLHSKTLQMYLSLLESSQKDDTLEASCGALQNLTSGQGIVSHVMSQTVVQKLNGLRVISPLLRSPKPSLQRGAISLLGNLARNPRLHTAIARQSLPDLAGVLSSGTKEGTESDDTLGVACQTAHTLILKESDLGKRLLTRPLVASLNDLSRNKYFPKSSKAAALLLNNLWSEKDIQSFLKKQGMTKASFVNDITTAVTRSGQLLQ